LSAKNTETAGKFTQIMAGKKLESINNMLFRKRIDEMWSIVPKILLYHR
jgi:hypothetical protein